MIQYCSSAPEKLQPEAVRPLRKAIASGSIGVGVIGCLDAHRYQSVAVS